MTDTPITLGPTYLRDEARKARNESKADYRRARTDLRRAERSRRTAADLRAAADRVERYGSEVVDAAELRRQADTWDKVAESAEAFAAKRRGWARTAAARARRYDKRAAQAEWEIIRAGAERI